MNLRKIIPTAIGALALCVLLPMAPQPGEAAEVTSIETPKAGDTTLRVTFTDGQPTDRYEIYVNGVAVNSGPLGSDVTNPDSMYFNLSYIPEGGTGTPVKAGDKIEFRLQKGSEMVSHEVTVAGEQTPNRPTSMKLESSTVARGDAVFATLIFDDAYVPDPDDRVLVQPYDEDGNALEGYIVDLPDVYDGSVKVQLKDSDKADYYTIAFVPGEGGSSSLSVRVDLTEGSTDPDTPSEPSDDQQDLINNAVAMTFTYPSNTVSLGESVSPAKPRPTPVRRSSATAVTPSPKERLTSTAVSPSALSRATSAPPSRSQPWSALSLRPLSSPCRLATRASS